MKSPLGYQVMREKDGWENPQKQNLVMKTMPVKQTEHMSCLGFGKPHKVLERWQRQLGQQGPEWSLWQSQWQSSDVRWWWGWTHPGHKSSAAHGWRAAEPIQLLKGKSAHEFPKVQIYNITAILLQNTLKMYTSLWVTGSLQCPWPVFPTKWFP